MALKALHLFIVAGLLAPAGVAAQSANGFSSGDEWRAHVDELCRTGEAGVDAANSMFGIAVRAGPDAARQYLDCFASEMTAIYEERAQDWGMRPHFRNASKPIDRACFQPFADGQRFSLRTLTHDQRQAILEAVAAP